MKIALLGTGKTGGKVVELHGADSVTQFNSANPPTLAKLKGHDVVISFVPGPIFVQYIDMLIESGLPVVSGSTGFDWPEDINQRLKAKNVAWITASNFSLGMNLVRGMIKVLAKAPLLFDNFDLKLHEIHHIHKKDQPSGTSLSWQKWVGQDVNITSGRDGDNPGDHKLTLVTPYEDISVQHQAKDRRIFAEGAIWTARKLLDIDLDPGLYDLAEVMEKELKI